YISQIDGLIIDTLPPPPHAYCVPLGEANRPAAGPSRGRRPARKQEGTPMIRPHLTPALRATLRPSRRLAQRLPSLAAACAVVALAAQHAGAQEAFYDTPLDIDLDAPFPG